MADDKEAVVLACKSLVFCALDLQIRGSQIVLLFLLLFNYVN